MKLRSENLTIGIRHLRAALAVAGTGSFALAAQRLHVVPSAITATIQQLEQDLGIRLFARTNRPLEITEAGAEFLARAQRILADLEALVDEQRQLAGLARGTIKVGAAPSAIQFLLAPAIASMRHLHPNIEITVLPDLARNLGDMVLDRNIDFAVAEKWYDNNDLAYEPLRQDSFVLVCHQDHALADRTSVSLDGIDASELIAIDPNTGTGQLQVATPEIEVLLAKSRLRAHDTVSALILISQGLGLGILPLLAASVLGSASIRCIPVRDLFLQRSIFLITRQQSWASPAADSLQQLIRIQSAQQIQNLY